VDAQGVITALEPKSSQNPTAFVVVNESKEPEPKQSGGIGIYFPDSPAGVSRYYKDLRFAKDCPSWPAFIELYRVMCP